MTRTPLLAITMGDPAGIGPEIALKALGTAGLHSVCRPIVIGDASVLEGAARACGIETMISAVAHPSEGRYAPNVLNVLNLDNLPAADLRIGCVTAAQGKAAYEYVAKAIELAMAGDVDGTVTGPINKEALNAAGYGYAGHTEIYGALTGTRDYAMMLAEGDFRVAHVSTHVSLREACDRATKPRILRVIQLAHRAMLDLGLSSPRIGVCGLNPHCGEGRLFGSEDEDEIRPAVEAACASGMAVEGPIPADTIFPKLKGGMYDIVVAMYHDQGHIPTKLTGFDYDVKSASWTKLSGVNVTLGLPIVRTSVDHGTAFDRAGTATANAQSMVEAITLAARLASSREEVKTGWSDNLDGA